MHFDAVWNEPAARIDSGEEETATIAAAQHGDSDAVMRLFRAYIRPLRAAVSRFSRVLARDDARQAAAEGLLSAVRAFDSAQSDRLASLLPTHLQGALTSAAGEATTGFAVPERTLKRFFGILARAEGDVGRAAEMAPAHAMAVDTFYAVLAAVTASGSLEAALDTDGGSAVLAGSITATRDFADADDRHMCRHALDAVTDLEADVCRLAYGFVEYDPIPDAEVGARLGMGRVKTLRVRQGALAKMRSALGA